ncbi:MAG: hypothetical protein VB934_17315 [Polyangiaceae bacterium]
MSCSVRAGAVLVSLAIGGCSTTAEVGGGDQALPTAQAGPFRSLTEDEIGGSRIAPYVIDDADDEVVGLTVLDTDGDPHTLATVAYGIELRSGTVWRFAASDGRSFARAGEMVLEPSEAWESEALDSVAAIRVSQGADVGQVALYYAAGGAIGLATSIDGVAFTKRAQPIVRAEDLGLVGQLAAPAVVEIEVGVYAMFFELRDVDGVRIYEARSANGVDWKLADPAPVLEPGLSSVDTLSVADPEAVTMISAIGRHVTWLYYSATDTQGQRVIAAAARHQGGRFMPAASPVFGSDGLFAPRAPAVVRFATFSLLFVTQRAGSTDNRDYEATAASVAPASAVLPPPIAP